MYTIKAPYKHGGVWDAEKNCLIEISGGELSTSDDRIAELARGAGLTVECELEEKKLEDMTVAELKAYAVTHAIELGEATKKADLLECIKVIENNGKKETED